MQKTKEGCRWTIRLSNKDYAQKEVIRMFEYLLSTGEYATESDIFREGIKSLYREKTEPDRIMDWDNRIQECARITANNVLERILAQRNQSIKKECAVLKESYINLISQADESTREKFITDKKEYQKSSAAKAEAILREMYAEAYCEMDAQTAMIRVETSLQNIVGDGRFYNGIVRTKGSR